MSTSGKQPNSKSEELAQTSLPDDAPAGEDEDAITDEEDAIPPPSEVTMRISLLGKLIIPPSTP